MPLYKHILLATDLDESSEAAVEKACDLAEEFHAELTLVHTIEPTPAYGYPGTVLESPVIKEAAKELEHLGEKLQVPKDNQRIEFGSVKHEVLKVAKELKVDLIIIGNHGRHGIARLLMDSSANAISHDAQCDVLTVGCFKPSRAHH